MSVNRTLMISGAIDDSIVKAVDIALADKELFTCIHYDASLNVVINSQGGDEHCGRAIAGLISLARKNGYKINTLGVGDIHSAAVLIFAAGERRVLSRFASVMVHESSAEVDGNSTAIKDYAKQMEREEQFWCDALATLTGTDAKTWMKLHTEETYLTPDEALKLNLATELV